jgi:hypothetical protein
MLILFSDIDDCEENPCGSGGECVDKVNGFSCNCRQGYTGDVCETGYIPLFCS